MASQTLLLVLFLGVSVAVEGGGFFPLTSPDNKIHSGSEIDIKRFPWIVVILRNDRQHCGGAIVNERWVLTAAHCTVNVSPSQLKLRAGSKRYDSGGQEYLVDYFVIHPKYRFKHHQNDISAVRTKRPIRFVGAVSRVKLPTSPPSPRTPLMTAGWGGVAHNQYSLTLKAAKVVVTEFQNCINYYTGTILDESFQICAIGVDGTNCGGDSGGPVMMGDVLVGLFSMYSVDQAPNKTVINNCPGWGPVIYTKVIFFRDWILKITKV